MLGVELEVESDTGVVVESLVGWVWEISVDDSGVVVAASLGEVATSLGVVAASLVVVGAAEGAAGAVGVVALLSRFTAAFLNDGRSAAKTTAKSSSDANST